jgi:hypothetical protein
MKALFPIGLMFAAAIGAAAGGVPVNAAPSGAWRVAGEMVEACTCQVPCTCQFGQGPSPTPRCASVSTFSIREGSRGDAALAGGAFAIVFGPKKTVLYAGGRDESQREALKAILQDIARKSGWKNSVIRESAISQSGDSDSVRSSIGDFAAMDASMLKGFDGKSPIVVENNNDFNVPRVEKGKTASLKYLDDLGNSIEAKDSNAGRGRFDWTNQTAEYFH